MNSVCDMCKAPLGAKLVEGAAGAEPKPWGWVLISAAITAGLGAVVWLFELGTPPLAAAMFYGPLVASYRAKDNIVWHAAIGGIVGMLALLFISVVLVWERSKALLIGAMGGDASTSAAIALALGSLVLLATILPISLIGASVGEHLAVRRRRNAVPASTTTAPAAMSDAELAKVDL